MYIHSAESYIVDSKVEKLEISKALKKYIPSSPRPATRFILLALVGVLKCVQKIDLNHESSVFLATEFGNIENIYKCLNDVYIKKELPMPFSFVNTLNNIAGFQRRSFLHTISI